MKKRINKKAELLAPAGNIDKMKTAFAFGADAVYAGVPDFSLRVRINDFTIEKIKEATEYSHKIGKKLYVTVNIFAHNNHLKKLPKHIEMLRKIGIDGIFISDPAILMQVKKNWPEANIILSTQANCTNWQAAKFWQAHGARRVILSRELSLADIKEIRKKLPKLELECFVHGALCMAYSGRCFLSKFYTDRNANLGDCVQPCRWKYDVFIAEENRPNDRLELIEEQHGSYLLNSQDLCLIRRLDELAKLKINAFKIEGRAKSVYYLGCVIGAYRKGIDTIYNTKIAAKKKKAILNFLYKELDEKLFHRGFTEGFLYNQGKIAQNTNDSHRRPEWEFCGQVVSSKKEKNRIVTKIFVHNSLKKNDLVEIIMPPYDTINLKVGKMYDETGDEMEEAHGGARKNIIIETKKIIPEFSLLRRKIN